MVSSYESKWAGPSCLQGPAVFFGMQAPTGVAVRTFYDILLLGSPTSSARDYAFHWRVVPLLLTFLAAPTRRQTRGASHQPAFNIQ